MSIPLLIRIKFLFSKYIRASVSNKIQQHLSFDDQGYTKAFYNVKTQFLIIKDANRMTGVDWYYVMSKNSGMSPASVDPLLVELFNRVESQYFHDQQPFNLSAVCGGVDNSLKQLLHN